jgi:SMODS domain-containing protein
VKLLRHFNHFLAETVNLNRSRLDTLSTSVDAVYAALKNDTELGDLIIGKIPQGSWAHRTIIKPLAGKEFDADFLVEFVEVDDWSEHPKAYIEALDDALGRNGTYKEMPRTRKCRCVRLTYKGDFHLDIVPYVHLSDGREVIVNSDDDEWEPTNPEGFTSWINGKDDIAGGNLRKVIRIMKYLRDHKGTFVGTRSIILTTLLGERVEGWRSATDPDYYTDVPSALVNITEDLDEWLQARPSRPSIADPSNSGATFDHRWSDASYEALRKRIHEYAADFRAAYDEPEAEASEAMWRKLFGDGFTAPPGGGGRGPFGVVPPAPTRPGRAG